MAGRITFVAFLGVVLISQTSCLNVGEERARLDEKVGKAALEDAAILTSDGLGHVRAFELGRIELWSQAPTYTIELTPGQTRAWTIELRNVLPETNLEGPAGQVNCTPGRAPTTRICDVQADGPVSFALSVAQDESQPLKFALFADVQKAIEEVDELFDAMAREDDVRFAVMSGDLTDTGTPAQLERFQTKMELLPYPVYATLGNHELGSGEDNFHRYFGRGNYSFEFAGRRFTMLDSAGAAIPQTVRGWLNNWLDAGDGKFHVVAMHIPPMDPVGGRNGGFASRDEARDLIAQFAKHDVDLTLYGHVHSYHEYENAGIPAFISGGGGAQGERLDDIDKHFVVFEVPPATQAGSRHPPFESWVVRVE